MNDSTTSFVSDVASETKFSFDIKLKKNRLIGFMKRKKQEFENRFEPIESDEDKLRSSCIGMLSNTTDAQSDFFSTALPYIDTVGIPQMIKTIEHHNEKTFLHSKRLKRIFRPL